MALLRAGLLQGAMSGSVVQQQSGSELMSLVPVIHQGLCDCLESGQLSETILVSEDLAATATGTILIRVAWAATRTMVTSRF